MGEDGLLLNHTQPAEIRTGSGVRSRGCSREGRVGPVLQRSAGPWATDEHSQPHSELQTLRVGIDLSCTPVAPEVFPAFRDSLHPTQPTHSFPARSSLSLLDPRMEVRATGGEEEDESPWQ